MPNTRELNIASMERELDIAMQALMPEIRAAVFMAEQECEFWPEGPILVWDFAALDRLQLWPSTDSEVKNAWRDIIDVEFLRETAALALQTVLLRMHEIPAEKLGHMAVLYNSTLDPSNAAKDMQRELSKLQTATTQNTGAHFETTMLLNRLLVLLQSLKDFYASDHSAQLQEEANTTIAACREQLRCLGPTPTTEQNMRTKPGWRDTEAYQRAVKQVLQSAVDWQTTGLAQGI